ncbi:MAG: hypothetical protein GY951_09055 [Psychromonas sp.]|nr:hypothetical protein [Alteromonadales bacterium]MCP5078187.1 hypothetical protein [Psychromonas sp.]
MAFKLITKPIKYTDLAMRKIKRKSETIYQKRWKVEVLHKNRKSNTGLAKSPAKKVRTQINHTFISLFATAKLEELSVKKRLTTFGLKTKLYIKAQKEAFKAWKQMQALTA